MKTEITALLTEKELLTQTFKKKQQDVITQLSAVDKKVNDIYHVFEFCKLDAVKMSKMARILADALKLRRELKETDIILKNCVDGGKFVAHELANSKGRVDSYEKEAKESLDKLLGGKP